LASDSGWDLVDLPGDHGEGGGEVEVDAMIDNHEDGVAAVPVARKPVSHPTLRTCRSRQ
jgi:hypothetical protein